MQPRAHHRQAFTLIELSIVLVVIGLLVGGVLVGRDLIAASQVRAQISQIEKYQQAVNAFKGKYGGLPGDLANAEALNFGFYRNPTGGCTLTTCNGYSNGNGVLESGQGVGQKGLPSTGSESALLWIDLASAGLIEGNFPGLQSFVGPPFNASNGNPSATGYNRFMPTSKLGNKVFIYTWSGGPNSAVTTISNGQNYFALSGVAVLGDTFLSASAGVLVSQAYNIDKKIDDGLPQFGSVIAAVPMNIWGFFIQFSDADPTTGGAVVAGDGISTTGSSTTCYDNGAVAGGLETYSITQNNGGGVNCALSFKFQ